MHIVVPIVPQRRVARNSTDCSNFNTTAQLHGLGRRAAEPSAPVTRPTRMTSKVRVKRAAYYLNFPLHFWGIDLLTCMLIFLVFVFFFLHSSIWTTCSHSPHFSVICSADAWMITAAPSLPTLRPQSHGVCSRHTANRVSCHNRRPPIPSSISRCRIRRLSHTLYTLCTLAHLTLSRAHWTRAWCNGQM